MTEAPPDKAPTAGHLFKMGLLGLLWILLTPIWAPLAIIGLLAMACVAIGEGAYEEWKAERAARKARKGT